MFSLSGNLPMSSATLTWELPNIILLLLPQHLQSGCSAMEIYLCVCVLRKKPVMDINGFVGGQREKQRASQPGDDRGGLREDVSVAWAWMMNRM